MYKVYILNGVDPYGEREFWDPVATERTKEEAESLVSKLRVAGETAQIREDSEPDILGAELPGARGVQLFS